MYHKHGRSQLPEYKCWQQIKQRCLNPRHLAYPNYGGRGITIADEWLNDFEAFFAYVGSRPSQHHSLDRIDNNAGYAPGNVRWASSKEQNNNRRPHGTGEVPTVVPREGWRTNFKHGLIHLPEYRIWMAMKDRCLNPRSNNYPGWGGRGIGIYGDWIKDFPAFYAYVGPRPTPQHSIDRIDNDRGYEPGNVRWATKKEQVANRRPGPKGICHGNATHGKVSTPEYKTWSSIKTRCFNAQSDRYEDYGGQGITVCGRWREDFEAFVADVGVKPSPQHTLSRLDHTGHYSCGVCGECCEKGWPSNCRWATKTEQNRIRRPSARSGKLNPEKVLEIRRLLADGWTQTAIAKKFGVGYTLIGKIHRGQAWR